MEIVAENISREYIRRGRGTNVLTAVAPCSLTVPEGQVTVIRGRSGSGKSTLLHMLAGILRPTEGRVLCGGKDLYAMSDRELSVFRSRHIGFIPQGRSAVASLTVEENVMLPLLLYGRRDEAAAAKLMERFSIDHLKGCRPGRLSGGELRRMAIARALVSGPEVLFADEPTGDLDDGNTQTVFRALRECAREGMAVLVVTHESGVEELADRVFLMRDGVPQEQERSRES